MDKILLVCSFFLLVITSIRCFFVKSKTTTDLLLNLVLISLIANSIILYLFFVDKLQDFIHLYRVGTFFTYTFIGSFYLYIKYSINKTIFNRLDLLVYLPALIYLVDYTPFFFSSAEIKRTAFFSDLQNETVSMHLQSAFIPNGAHFMFQNLMGIVVSILSIIRVFTSLRNGGQSFFKDNRSIVFWFSVWSVLLFFSTLPDFLRAITDIHLDLKQYIFITPCVLLYLSLPLSLLLIPELLYGTRGFWINRRVSFEQVLDHHYLSDRDTGSNIEVADILSHSSNLLRQVRKHEETRESGSEKRAYYDRKKAESMKKSLDQFMNNTEIFLNCDLNIQDIASQTEFSVRQISSLLNNYANSSFKDYVNSFRVNAFIKYYRQKENRDKSIESICMQFGFNNRHTFLHAFKKITGQTPSSFFNNKHN